MGEPTANTKSFFEASLKQPFEQWAELEATYHFVSTNCPELLARTYVEARAAAVQRLAVEVENQPLGKVGVPEGTVHNPEGKYRSVRAAAMDAGIVEKRLSIPVDSVKAAIALSQLKMRSSIARS